MAAWRNRFTDSGLTPDLLVQARRAPVQPATGVRVCAVVVTFQPDFGILGRMLDGLRPQVAEVIVVDNGSDADVCAWVAARQDADLRCLPLGCNTGVASAQNRGIDDAVARGASHVLLMDQDSLPAGDMVQRLLEVSLARPDAGAVGPFYQDPRQRDTSPFIEIRGWRVVRHFPSEGVTDTPVDYLIASGSLISVEALRTVGPMRDDLFIDYVDIEWGLRARSRGLRNYGVFGARMAHDLGEAPIEFRGRSIPVHSPLRHYYIMRNALLLYRDPRVPAHWKWVDGSRLVLKFGFYSLFTARPLQHLRMMLRGLWDGLRGRGGPYAG